MQNSPRSTRRRWLESTIAGTAAGCWALSRGVSRAIEPVTRVPGAKFKFSLAAYSYRDFLKGESPRLTLSDFVHDCAEMGLEGTELTSYYFPKNLTDDFLRNLAAECFRQGLDVSGTAVGNDFCHPAGPKRDEEIANVKTWIDRAAILGAPVIRVFSGDTKSGQSPDDAHRLAVEALEECCAYAGQQGVYLALENHGGLTTQVEGLLRLVNDVKSPWFGVNMDTGNFHSADVYADLSKLAPYTLNVQVKVSVQPAGGTRQPCDLARVARLLRDTGYRGYVVLEYEEREDPRQACPRHLADLRAAFS